MIELEVVARYNEPAKARLVHDAFVPAAADAVAAGLHARVERHWRHGPHLALALTGESTAVTRTATEAACRIDEAVRAHPSRLVIGDAELLAASRRAGRVELVPGPYEPITPDNTVTVRVPDRAHLHHLLGGAGAVGVRDDLLCAAIPAIGHTTATARTSSARVLAVVVAMAVHSCSYRPGPTGGAMSFLSHLEDFLHRSCDGPDLRAGFERIWAPRAAMLTAMVEALFIVGRDPAGVDAATVRTWGDWSAQALVLADAGYADGHIPLLPGTHYRAAAERLDDSRFDGVDLSPFHRHIAGRFDPTAVAEHFGPYRFATNVLYQVLLVCDVTPAERYLAAYLLSNAVARLTGVDWHERSHQSQQNQEVAS